MIFSSQALSFFSMLKKILGFCANLSIVRSTRGQVAIFVALIFQVLFVFFAMIVNVGLLVHHKINLQNSVDLAAYYGAMKQAESMNAIAHINYQLRQSYKLMMFRYREIGTAGDITNHPWNPGVKNFRPGAENDQPVSYNPSFCLSYAPFDFMATSTESYCRDATGLEIRLPGKIEMVSTGLSLISPLLAFQNTVQAAFVEATQRGLSACRKTSNIGYYALARFVYAYKMDMALRKKLLIRLANGMSKDVTDIEDLDGESVKDGVRKTLEYNLTQQNRDSMKAGNFRFLNSLGGGACGKTGSAEEPPGWLKEIFIYPTYTLLDADCNQPITQNVHYKLTPKFINSGRPSDDPFPANLESPFNESIPPLMTYVKEPSGATALTKLYKTTIGFEKDPWCMAYVAVEAESTPNIPFSPFGAVKMKARAFAKPFGGRIGPWHREIWGQGSATSNSGREVDPLLPPRVSAEQNQADLSDDRVRGNYSRFVGDKVGIAAKRHTGNMSRGIYASTYNNLLTLSWWNHLAKDGSSLSDIANPGDTLAWDSNANRAVGRMRELETIAIAPNQFDLTYYSIEPDFHRNYQRRLEKRAQSFGFNVLGDHGSRKDSSDVKLKGFSVKDQIALASGSDLIGGSSKLPYIVKDFAELLTSFQSQSPKKHILDPGRFGQCRSGFSIPDDAVAEKATSGNCIEGGRTGYSVKLVDGDFLKASDLELGGKGTSGPIKNQWSEETFTR